MSFKERWAEFIYQMTKRSLRFRTLVTPVGLLFWFGLTVLLLFASLWVDGAAHFPVFVTPPLSFIIGSILIVTWAPLCGWPVMRFFMARGSPVPLNPPQELVVTGPYAYVRNPMVTGWIVGMLGLGVLLGSITFTFIATPIFAILNVLYLRAIEEREMENHL